MSDPEKDKNNPEVPTEEIVDAVIIEEEDQKTNKDNSADTPEEESGEAAEIAEETSDDTPEDDDTAAEEIPPEADTVTAPPPEDPVVVQKVGFVPLVLGGVVAAGLGFGASQFIFPEGLSGSKSIAAIEALDAQLRKQNATMAALEKRLVAAENITVPEPDLSPVTDAVLGVETAMSELSAQYAGLESRLTDLEKRPAEGGAAAAAVEAYEREVKALKDAMEKQKVEVDALVSAAQEDKASAEMTAQQAMIRSAISRVQIALDTGASFADAMADLEAAGLTVPAALSAVADTGVATIAQLTVDYPIAARNALAASRKDEGTGGNVWNFFRNQLGVRSLEPKEGEGADAVLSRAEAALADGRLTDAMAELEGLPEEGRVELTDWMARATQRAEAIAAAEDLSAQVASN